MAIFQKLEMNKKEKLAEDIGKCLGKWVAEYDGCLIASGDSIEEVKKASEEKGINNPIIWQVPTLLGRLYL